MEGLILPLLFVALLLPLFLSSRKQRRIQQETLQLQNSLQVGDEVMTSSGLYGTIAELEEDTIDLEVSPGVYTTWSRFAIKERVPDEADTETDEAETDTEAEDSAQDSAKDDVVEVENGQPSAEGRG